jgi:hypothetical protein
MRAYWGSGGRAPSEFKDGGKVLKISLVEGFHHKRPHFCGHGSVVSVLNSSPYEIVLFHVKICSPSEKSY